MKYVGIIPARGGSKGVPHKNKKLINGKPLICYTIESAIKANILDYIFVSSDDKEILDIAAAYEGVIGIDRPIEFALDSSTTEEVLVHIIKEMGFDKSEENYAIITLEPTSPFRKPGTIRQAIKLFGINDYRSSVVSVVEDYGVYYLDDKRSLSPLFPNLPRRRQDRDPLLQEKSLIYVTPLEDLVNGSLVLGNRSIPFIVDEHEAFDINTVSDFSFAEYKMKFEK